MDSTLSDFHITLKNIKFLSPKVNEGLQLLFVVNGEITVEIDSRFYELNEQDLLVINRHQLYQVQGNESNCVLSLMISDSFMDQYYPDYPNSRFECYSQETDIGREKMLNDLRKLLIELVISNSRKDESYKIEMQSYLCEILIILIRGFKQKSNAIGMSETDDYRLKEIIHYLEKNYQQVITLEDVAKRSYLSTGYLSRYFKQKMGMGFSRFLNTVRLKHSVKDLLYTDHTISQIAMKNGFANTKSFASLFKKVYGITPNVYREQNSKERIESFQDYSIEDEETYIHSSEILTKLGNMLNKHEQTYPNRKSQFEELRINLSIPLNLKVSRPKHVLIVRELKELLKENVRSQLLKAKAELGVGYIGIGNLLKGETITADVETDEVIATSSPYFKADVALNFIQKNGFTLFIRVDYQEITLDEENNLKKLYEFLRHCLQVYGASYLKTWNFLYYEPYYTAVEAKELKRVYIKVRKLLKSLIPTMQVGVFLPFSFSDTKIGTSHRWVLEEEGIIDFIGYNSNPNKMVDFHELDEERFDHVKDYLKERTSTIKSYLKKHSIEKPLHLIAWNTLSGNTRFTNGSFFRAALVLKGVLDIADEVESIGFWINTALHESDSNGQRIRTEGLELFHYFSGKRPAYFAMLFAKKLNGHIVAKGSDYIMTKNDRGYQLLLMNCNTVNPYYSLEDSLLQKLNKEILVKISGIEEGEYQIRKFVFDRDHGALYMKWLKLNSKYGLDSEIIDYINRTSYPNLELFDETIKGTWSFYSYLTVNAIHFFDIRKAII